MLVSRWNNDHNLLTGDSQSIRKRELVDGTAVRKETLVSYMIMLNFISDATYCGSQSDSRTHCSIWTSTMAYGQGNDIF